MIDVARRRIPNALSLAIAAAGVVLAATGASGISLPSSLFGFALAFALMLPGHVLGATGAGDVKLFAAAGAVLGAGRVVDAFVSVAIVGGLCALAIAWRRGRLTRTITQTMRLCGRSDEARVAIEAPSEHNRFPYAPAIAAGCVIAVMW